MRFNKLFSAKSITNLLYGFLLLMPFCAVFGRLIYTQSNLNAKDSYYGDTINESVTINVDLPLVNITTYVNSTPVSVSASGSFNKTFTYISAEIVGVSTYDLSLANNFRLYSNATGNLEAVFFSGSTTVYDIYLTRDNLLLKFVLGSIQDYNNGSNNFDNKKMFYYLEYNKYSYLDNAFEYSLATFVDDNNFGGVDFFGWFTNLFLNQSNPHNALYLNFTNWYLNYSLLVSSGYLLFLVLIWFINYVRRILDKSMNYEGGGF